MSYYAAEGQISRSPIEGGIEISAEQYQEALDGMMAGKIVTINGGFAVIDPPPPPPEPEPEPPTLDEVVEFFRHAIQAHVDAQVRTRQYESGVSLASYAASTNPRWAAEAAVFIAWRDAVWAHAYTELDKVMDGEREQPTVEDFIAELPDIEWPE